MSIASAFPSVSPSLLLDFANSKSLDPRVTFTRASTAAYYDGKTYAKAEENLLFYSTSSTGGQPAGVSVTDNYAASPDGTTTAMRVICNSGTSRHYFNSSQTYLYASSGTTMTGSVYVKAGSATHVSVLLRDNNNGGGALYCITVNLSSGAVGGFSYSQVCSGTSYSVTSVGSSWWRIALTFTTSADAPAAAQGACIGVTPMFNDGTGYANFDGYPEFAGDGTSDMLTWGFQLEYRSSATAYTATTGTPVTNYIPVLKTAAADVARFDHDPATGESLGLLSEEARSNYLVRSEDFSHAAWTKASVTALANVNVAPSGAVTANLLYPDSSGASRYVYLPSVGQLISASSAVTNSVYAKAAGKNWIYIRIEKKDNLSYFAWFNLSNGTVGTVQSSITASIQAVGDGWYRCTVTLDDIGTGGSPADNTWLLGVCDSDNVNTVTASGINGVFIWGAQCEVGKYVSSYVATAAAATTRAADNASMTGTNFSSWFNQGAGSVLIENRYGGGSAAFPNNRIAFMFTNASKSQYWILYNGSGGLTNILYVSINGGLFGTGGGATSSTKATACIAYAPQDYAISNNGGAVATNTIYNVPETTQLAIGSGGGTNYLGGWIAKFAYYPLRLTNAQLQALTVL